MALLVGVERGYITREQGVERMLKILNFLKNNADKFHGHFHIGLTELPAMLFHLDNMMMAAIWLKHLL